MKSLVLSQWNFPLLPTMALMIFFLLFVGVIWWVNRNENKEIYKKLEQLPLEEGSYYE